MSVAVVLLVGWVADLLEAVDELADVLLGAAEGVDVALGGGRRAPLGVGAVAQGDLLVEGCVGLELVAEGGGGDAGDVRDVGGVDPLPAPLGVLLAGRRAIAAVAEGVGGGVAPGGMTDLRAW